VRHLLVELVELVRLSRGLRRLRRAHLLGHAHRLSRLRLRLRRGLRDTVTIRRDLLRRPLRARRLLQLTLKGRGDACDALDLSCHRQLPGSRHSHLLCRARPLVRRGRLHLTQLVAQLLQLQLRAGSAVLVAHLLAVQALVHLLDRGRLDHGDEIALDHNAVPGLGLRRTRLEFLEHRARLSQRARQHHAPRLVETLDGVRLDDLNVAQLGAEHAQRRARPHRILEVREAEANEPHRKLVLVSEVLPVVRLRPRPDLGKGAPVRAHHELGLAVRRRRQQLAHFAHHRRLGGAAHHRHVFAPLAFKPPGIRLEDDLVTRPVLGIVGDVCGDQLCDQRSAAHPARPIAVELDAGLRAEQIQVHLPDVVLVPVRRARPVHRPCHRPDARLDVGNN